MAVYTKGMDPAAIEASGNHLISFKNQIHDVVTAVTTAVSTIHGNWGGADSNQFVTDWNSHKVTVNNAAESLAKMGQKCKTNASQQQSVSGH